MEIGLTIFSSVTLFSYYLKVHKQIIPTKMNEQILSSSRYGSESLFLEKGGELTVDKLNMNDFSWYRDDFDDELTPAQGDKPMPLFDLNDGSLQYDDPAACLCPTAVEKHDMVVPYKHKKISVPSKPAFVRSTSLPRLSTSENISPPLKRTVVRATPDLPVSFVKNKRRQSLPVKLTGGTLLGSQYQPSSWDVVCGRGRGKSYHERDH